MKNGLVELQVCSKGKPVREFGLDGRVFIEGRKGTSFVIKVKNHNPFKVNAVVFVDGINVVSGDDEKKRGYVIPAYGSYEISGWRKSLDGVAKFIFASKNGKKVYAKSKGTLDKAGMISMFAYAEKGKPEQAVKTVYVDRYVYPYPYVYPTYHPWNSYPWWYYGGSSTVTIMGSGSSVGTTLGAATACTSAVASGINLSTTQASCNNSMTFTANCSSLDGVAGSAGATGSSGVQMFNCSVSDASSSASCGSTTTAPLDLGTAWGDHEESKVEQVEFENGYQIAGYDLYYADSKALKELGIDTSKSTAISGLPSMAGDFCKAPV